jgi:hypothetical protein
MTANDLSGFDVHFDGFKRTSVLFYLTRASSFDNQAPLFQLTVYLLLHPDVFILASFHCILAGTTVISRIAACEQETSALSPSCISNTLVDNL